MHQSIVYNIYLFYILIVRKGATQVPAWIVLKLMQQWDADCYKKEISNLLTSQ